MVYCGRELLSVVGSGSLQKGVVVCDREWLSVVGSCGLRKGVIICGREWLPYGGGTGPFLDVPFWPKIDNNFEPRPNTNLAKTA